MKALKKAVTGLNILLFAGLLVSTVVYMRRGGLSVKATTASFFALSGVVNMIYALLVRNVRKGFPVAMGIGLVVCMLADILLNVNFIPGAALFAVGHLFYITAFCLRSRWIRLDAIFSAALALLSCLLLLVLELDFDNEFLRVACMGYAIVISFMVGKAVSTAVRERSLVGILMGVGSVLFFFSDLMLLLYFFGNASRLADRLCLISYFPAQGLLASTIFFQVNKEMTHERSSCG